MPRYYITLSRPAREYRTVAGIVARTEAEARRIALRVSLEADATHNPEAVFAECGLDPAHADLSEWGTYQTLRARVRVENVETALLPNEP